MNNEEKILALLEKQDARLGKIETQLAAQGEQLNAQGEELAAQRKQLNAQGEQLAAQGEELAAQRKQLNALGEQLAAQQDQLNKLSDMQDELRKSINHVAFIQEHIVTPSLRTIAASYSDLWKEMASEESVNKLKSDVHLALSGIKTHTAQIAALSDRVAKLEKAN